MKNIFVEGIQGSGKSTLINNIVKFNPELHVCREGDYSPIDLAWCALMSKKEYEAVLEKYNSIRDEIIKNTVREQENYIITYTKIITDIPGFYKDLENYELTKDEIQNKATELFGNQFKKQFPQEGTKVTISSADIEFIKDRVMHIYSLGVNIVNINVVFVDVWKEGDDKRFEEQLIQLADAIIDGEYYTD